MVIRLARNILAYILVCFGDCRRVDLRGRDRRPQAVGYTDVTHLGPAILGTILYLAGLVLTWNGCKQ